jgi:hypothetical protein
MKDHDQRLPMIPRLEEADTERRYQQAKEYFRQSAGAAARVNAALVVCVGVYLVRLARLAWEGLRAVWARWRR